MNTEMFNSPPVPIRKSMKRCYCCGKDKELEKFYKDKSRKDGRCNKCKNCSKNYYDDNIIYFKSHGKEARVKRSIENRVKLFEYLLENPCVDCGEGDILVLEFDHSRGKKIQPVTQMIYHYWKRIQKEIEKCDVRCANCHARKTAERANSPRLQFVIEKGV